jgi:CO/xanthine dehydrogenase Mo-binding subunit
LIRRASATSSTAIGNAIFNASGTRLRHLPFTPDKLFTAD